MPATCLYSDLENELADEALEHRFEATWGFRMFREQMLAESVNSGLVCDYDCMMNTISTIAKIYFVTTAIDSKSGPVRILQV